MRPPWARRARATRQLLGGSLDEATAKLAAGPSVDEATAIVDDVLRAVGAPDETVDSIHVTAPPDRGALFTYQSLAESRLEEIRDLQAALDAAHAETDRLRNDVALAGQRLPCGGCQRLAEANTRLENHLETCRREHLDKDAADALRAQLAMRVGAAQPW